MVAQIKEIDVDCEYKWTSAVIRCYPDSVFCTHPTMDKFFCDECNDNMELIKQRVLDETWKPFIDNCNQHFKGLDTTV